MDVRRSTYYARAGASIKIADNINVCSSCLVWLLFQQQHCQHGTSLLDPEHIAPINMQIKYSKSNIQ